MLKHVLNAPRSLNNIGPENKSMLRPTKNIIVNSNVIIKKHIPKSMKSLSANIAKAIVKKSIRRHASAVKKTWNIIAKLDENPATNMLKNVTHINESTAKRIAKS
jgi:hypothetical protein